MKLPRVVTATTTPRWAATSSLRVGERAFAPAPVGAICGNVISTGTNYLPDTTAKLYHTFPGLVT